MRRFEQQERLDSLLNTARESVPGASWPQSPRDFRVQMFRRRRAAGVMAQLPRLAYEQGIGFDREDKYPVWKADREVRLHATQTFQLGEATCALVDAKMYHRPLAWVESSIVVLKDPEDVFGGGEAVATTSRGELYLPNLLTPDQEQTEIINEFVHFAIYETNIDVSSLRENYGS